ncbi:DMT family transporter [Agromyces fucosus]|uniref:DMT family transporter n=1 Tax=Agromyces fucosus TaxID=41985 RepID=A0A4V1QRX5_9MICO|nr:DMT family transporter [Agromyces fucosus]RXZ46413.1 DMT family transporter [Agromyces fucosus]
MRGSKGVLGIVLGLAAGLAFGAGGVVVKPLLESGWSPGAAVFARISVAALALIVPGLIALKFDLRPLWRARWTVLAYALIAVVGTQVAFYASIALIPVSTTLLIEYLAPVALVLVAWARQRRAPQFVVIAGSVLAITGLYLVIGPGGGGLDVVGLLLAGVAMVGVCVYYVLGERADASVPPISLAASGFVVGAIVLGALGIVGVVPFSAELVDVQYFGTVAPWWLPVLTVGLVSTAFAYVAGISAIRLLGTRLSSFLGLSEVIFAAIVAWFVLGEAIGPLQAAGGLLILGGIVLVRFERPRDAASVALDIDLVPVAVDARD